MKLSLSLIRWPDFGRRALQEEDFWRIAEALQVTVISAPLKHFAGCYVAQRGREYIIINSRLQGLAWLWTAFHELAHATLHTAGRATTSKKMHKLNVSKCDTIAQGVALVALLPDVRLRRWLHSPPECEFARRLLRLRLEMLM